MKANREDVVQAALIVERWCDEHGDFSQNLYHSEMRCDCPFNVNGTFCMMQRNEVPTLWGLGAKLRSRGIKKE